MPMDTSWLEQTRTAAVVDRLIIMVGLVQPVSREEFAGWIPPGGPRSTVLQPRWNLRAVGEDDRIYRITVQDPPPLPTLLATFDRLHSHHPLVSSPQLELLELAVDTYPKDPDSLDLERIVADLFKGAKFSPSENIRAAGAYRGSGRGLLGQDGTYRALKADLTTYQGDSREDHALRWYVKRTDDAGRYKLPQSEHRCRFEIEYRRSGLPVRPLAELKGFRYQSLAKDFQVWRTRDGLGALAARVADRRMKLGRETRRVRHRRAFSECAFVGYNARVYEALRLLTTKMNKVVTGPYRHVVGSMPSSSDRVESVITDRFSGCGDR